MSEFRPPQTKIFNHKRYERSGAMNKSSAEGYAKRVREAGRLARVVKYVDYMKRTFYYVYTRNK